MKKLILCLFCCFTIGAYAQDTVKKSNSTGDFNEQFAVLKSNKKMRQGSYKLLYQKKVVAAGNYDQGKKVGLWSFYTDDKMVQQYDFSANKLISNDPEKGFSFSVTYNPGDVVTNPVKIGGATAGLKFLLAYTNFADVISGLSGKISVNHTITLDENGKIATWVTMVKSDEGLKVNNQVLVDVPEDAMLFLPATVNGKPAASAIAFHDELKGASSGERDNSDRSASKNDSGNGKASSTKRNAIP